MGSVSVVAAADNKKDIWILTLLSTLSGCIRIDAPGQVTISGAGDHTLAIRKDGRVTCWGENFDGQLGVADPTPCGAVVVPRIHKVVSLATGRSHTCALQANGAVFCWGKDPAHQDDQPRASPEPVLKNMKGLAG